MAAKPQYSESPQQFRERLEQPHNRIGWAFEERPDLDSSASFVLLALAFKAREGGTSTLAVETVCRLTRLSRPTVRAALKRLVLAGLIVPTGKSPGRWTNKYRLALSPYDLKMPTQGEREPVPRRFPRTGKRAKVQTIQPESSLPVEPESSLPVEPESSLPRESRRLRKAKKKGLRPASPTFKDSTEPASATAPAATANGAVAPTAPRNGSHTSGDGDSFGDEAYKRYLSGLSQTAPPLEPDPEPERDPKPDLAGVTAAAGKLSEEVVSCCGRHLDGAWARYPHLARELGKRDRREVVKLLSSYLEGSGGWEVPEPDQFFTYYEPLRDAWREGQKRSRPRNGRRRAT